MNTNIMSGVAAALLTGALPVLAAPAPPPPPPHAVTFAEVTAAADKAWSRLDLNHDGRIDAADRDARMLQRFDAWDTNHDGTISKDEFLAHIHLHQAQWRDHGGGAAEPAMAPGGGQHWHGGDWDKRDWHGGDWDKRDWHGGDWHARDGQDHAGRVVMALVGDAMHDARHDGAITRAAFDAAVKARFDAIDTNHDGTLTREEIRAARVADANPHGGWRRRPQRAGHDSAMPSATPTP